MNKNNSRPKEGKWSSWGPFDNLLSESLEKNKKKSPGMHRESPKNLKVKYSEK